MTAPAPLTPSDCNLQDFPFMPLDVARLRDSDMAAYVSPEACWAAVLLWSAAWHQVPAASLPDDDRFLAKAAGYGRVVKEWLNVREGALHGWVKCADGRLYHPVVAEKANESWRAKLHHAWKKECDRIRKANKQREAEGKPPLPFPPEPTLHSVQIPGEHTGIPPEAKTNSGGNHGAFETSQEQAEAAELSGVVNTAQESGTRDVNLTSEGDQDAIPAEISSIPQESTGASNGIENYSTGIPLENALKGQGEGQGQGELKAFDSDARASAPPELRANDAPATTPAALSMVMRRFGISSNPGDMRLVTLAAQGVTAETMTAACEDARKAKKGAPIPPGFVFSILERWAKEAAELNAVGATQPGATTTLTKAGQATARNMEAWLERKRQEQEQSHG